jgi:FtsP/CotA-like multicopper oxidase with cupredoxin domain
MGNMMNNNMNMTGEPVPVTEGNFTSPLIIPTVVGSSTTLTAQNVWANINGFGNISGLGYSSNGLLGPTIKVNNGSAVNISLVNQLNENTNIHWHGLKVPANMDGHPENVVGAGSSFNYNFAINQRAGLY